MNKKYFVNGLSATMLAAVLLFSGCKSAYRLVAVEGSKTEISSKWDRNPNEEAISVLTPYKAQIDSIMTPVIGKSAMDMKADRPESLLSNLVADVLRQAASNYIGKPADMAVTN